MIKVLYLANFAPPDQSSDPVNAASDGNQPLYHEEIFEILEKSGFLVVPARDPQILIDRYKEFDFVFSLLNRAKYRGSEILISALCEYFGLPYLGARPNIRAVAEDKQIAKLVARQFGFDVPKSRIYQGISDIECPPSFGGPYIAKPRCGASSKYISETCIQDCWDELKPEIVRLLAYGDDVIVEEFIDGINISLPVVGGNPLLFLPTYKLETTNKGQLITYDQKRHTAPGLNRSIFEDTQVNNLIRVRATRLYEELQPLDYFRMDFRLTPTNLPVFLEFNVCCNIGSKSGFSFCANQVGLSHVELVTRILQWSFSRQKIAWKSL